MRIAAILAALVVFARPALADEFVFPGLIEPSNRGVLSSHIDGVVAAVNFRGGETVVKGQPLIDLDPADAQLAMRAAEARLAEAEALLGGARRNAGRQEELLSRGVTPDAVAGRARTALAAAQAAVALAQAERDRAQLDVTRTTIRAPVSGVITPSNVAVGNFVEAEAGPPLAAILTLDPVLVAYDVPYADRVAALRGSSAANLEELFDRIELTLTLPGGATYPYTTKPEYASAELDPETGALTVWATVANPDTVLRPGLRIIVTSTVRPAGSAQ